MMDVQTDDPVLSLKRKLPFQKISVVGLGYIGLPTAAMFASRRINVVGIDINPVIVERINKGKIHIVEPDLDIVVHAAVTQGYLRASLKAEKAEVFLVAVPTPFKGANKDPDTKYIEAAVNTIAPVLESGNLVILESTSPIGTTEKMAEWLSKARPDLTFPQTHGEDSDIRIAHCPERVLPGKVMQELILNDRVIGGMTKKCSDLAIQLYKCFVTGECVITNSKSAEMAKLVENSFRDVNIAFANELSLICDNLDMDVWEVISLANRHPRVDILRPGPGVGGHCIAVDPWFIVASDPENSRMIRTAREVNDGKPVWVLEKIKNAVSAFLHQYPKLDHEDVTIACYGLAFKPDIDDLRESAALQITRELIEQHSGIVVIVEPNIDQLPEDMGRAELVHIDAAYQRADVHVFLVAHSEFKVAQRPVRFCVDTVGL